MRITSRAGEIVARLRFDADLRSDLVLVNPAQWMGDDKGVNQLREAHTTDMGDGAAMHETMVSISEVGEPATLD